MTEALRLAERVINLTGGKPLNGNMYNSSACGDKPGSRGSPGGADLALDAIEKA
ncbi:MAG: hypothetical protein ACM4D3_04835 [Candidatus Sericytochromatia bacterium]